MGSPASWVVVGLYNGGTSNNATVLDASGRFLVDRLIVGACRRPGHPWPRERGRHHLIQGRHQLLPAGLARVRRPRGPEARLELPVVYNNGANTEAGEDEFAKLIVHEHPLGAATAGPGGQAGRAHLHREQALDPGAWPVEAAAEPAAIRYASPTGERVFEGRLPKPQRAASGAASWLGGFHPVGSSTDRRRMSVAVVVPAWRQAGF